MTSAFGITLGDNPVICDASNNLLGGTVLTGLQPCEVPKAFLNYISLTKTTKTPLWAMNRWAAGVAVPTDAGSTAPKAYLHAVHTVQQKHEHGPARPPYGI
jgi:hypothetical protein